MTISSLGRASHLSPDAHRLFRALIDHVIASGAAPTLVDLASSAGFPEGRVAEVLAEVVAGEWAGRDAAGHLTALYPFATRPTGIRVALAEGERAAMCAIDALGIAPMLARTVVVTSACPVCDAPLHLTVTPEGVTEADPAGLAVLRRRTPGPAHQTRCAATRFVCSPEHGAAWLGEHGGPDDIVEPLPAAFAEAERIFGAAYRHGRCDCPGDGPAAGVDGERSAGCA